MKLCAPTTTDRACGAESAYRLIGARLIDKPCSSKPVSRFGTASAIVCGRSAELHLSLPDMRKKHEVAGARVAPAARWMAPEAAAEILGLSVVTLRRTLERNARAEPGEATIARVDGITGRKVGRLWRVQLDARWMGSPIEQE